MNTDVVPSALAGAPFDANAAPAWPTRERPDRDGRRA